MPYFTKRNLYGGHYHWLIWALLSVTNTVNWQKCPEISRGFCYSLENILVDVLPPQTNACFSTNILYSLWCSQCQAPGLRNTAPFFLLYLMMLQTANLRFHSHSLNTCLVLSGEPDKSSYSISLCCTQISSFLFYKIKCHHWVPDYHTPMH